MARLLLVAAVLGCLAIGGWLRQWWRTPAPVPDHAPPLAATLEMKFAGETVLAQRVRPTRDRLTAVDLLIAAERPDLPGTVHLAIEEWPAGQVVRTARLPAAAAPVGSAWELRPGQPGRRERWLSFGFEPIAGSAGRTYLLVLRYPDGQDAPGARLATLAHFPNSYLPGELRVNGFPVGEAGGTLLFRLAAAGSRGAAVLGAADNLARAQPFVPGTLVLPGALAATCGGLAAALIWVMLKRQIGGEAGEPTCPTTTRSR